MKKLIVFPLILLFSLGFGQNETEKDKDKVGLSAKDYYDSQAPRLKYDRPDFEKQAKEVHQMADDVRNNRYDRDSDYNARGNGRENNSSRNSDFERLKQTPEDAAKSTVQSELLERAAKTGVGRSTVGKAVLGLIGVATGGIATFIQEVANPGQLANDTRAGQARNGLEAMSDFVTDEEREQLEHYLIDYETTGNEQAKNNYDKAMDNIEYERMNPGTNLRNTAEVLSALHNNGLITPSEGRRLDSHIRNGRYTSLQREVDKIYSRVYDGKLGKVHSRQNCTIKTEELEVEPIDY